MSSSHHNRRIRYAQNFLHDRRLVERLVAESSIGAGDIVLEIGPGNGIITDALARSCDHIIAVEKDERHVEHLRARFRQRPQVTVFWSDFLEFPLPATRYKVFASIPYNITTAIVAKLTSGVSPPQDMFLVVQREAAEKFTGSPVGTLFALDLAPWFELTILRDLRRTDFRPIPAVDSVVLRFQRRPEPLVSGDMRGAYRDLITTLFTAWKPSVSEALQSIAPASIVHELRGEFGPALARRPGQVPCELWLRLFEFLVDRDDDRIWDAVRGSSQRLKDQQATLQKRHRTPVHRETRKR